MTKLADENFSLHGVNVLVTRDEGEDGPLSRCLKALGARVLCWPVVRVVPPADPAPLAAALERLANYDWIVFTSPRAVAAVGEGRALPASVRVAAVGAATAAALGEIGWPVHRMPEEAFRGEALVEVFAAAGDLAGARILLPAGDRARRQVPEGLRALGARVDEVVAYRTVVGAEVLDHETCRREIEAGIAAITFASPSAVHGLAEALGQELLRSLAGVPAVAIGPTTAAALAEIGLEAAALAEPSTLEGLAAAVARNHLAPGSSGTSENSPGTSGGEDGADVTAWLRAWSAGDPAALEALIPVVYAELHRVAEHHLRAERQGHTLQCTALVHEAYLRLLEQQAMRWENRSQFYGVASQLMRRILVDHARAQRAAKRGGGLKLSLDEAPEAAEVAAGQDLDLLVLDDALERLTAMDPRQGRIVELRFFGGLNLEETAQVMELSAATVKREWSSARAWLYGQLA